MGVVVAPGLSESLFLSHAVANDGGDIIFSNICLNAVKDGVPSFFYNGGSIPAIVRLVPYPIRWNLSHGIFFISDRRNGTHVFLWGCESTNHGHALGDCVFEVYNLLSAHGRLSAQLSTVVLRPQYFRSAKQQLRLLSVVYDWWEMALPVCFEEVIFAGRSGRGYVNSSRVADLGTQLLSFRSFVLSQFARIEDLPRLHRASAVIVVKDNNAADHVSTILAPDILISNLTRRFPDVSFRSISWTNVTLLEQVRILAHTDIMVSLPGSDAMPAVWLPRRSCLILPCRPLLKHGKNNSVIKHQEYSNEVPGWFRHRAPDLHVVQYCAHAERNIRWGFGVFLDADRLATEISDCLEDLANAKIVDRRRRTAS